MHIQSQRGCSRYIDIGTFFTYCASASSLSSLIQLAWANQILTMSETLAYLSTLLIIGKGKRRLTYFRGWHDLNLIRVQSISAPCWPRSTAGRNLESN